MLSVMQQSRKTCLLMICLLSLISCSGMPKEDSNALTSGAIGAAGGAIGTVFLGGCVACSAAIGGVIGAASSYVFDYLENDEAFEEE